MPLSPTTAEAQRTEGAVNRALTKRKGVRMSMQEMGIILPMFMDKKIFEKRGEYVQRTYKTIATDLKASTEVHEMVRETTIEQNIASYLKNYAQTLENTKKQGSIQSKKRIDLLS